jgi:hypothetical protein
LLAAYFTGDSHGKSKEACCDAQEKFETQQGKHQKDRKAHDAQKGKVQGPACGQWCPETRGQEQAAIEDRGKKAPRSTPRQAVVRVEDTIIDVIEEPVPGVVVVTEYESVRTASPISPGRKPKRGAGPETEEQ